MAAPVRYFLELGGLSLPVREARGREAVNETFALEVALRLPDGVELDPDALVRTEAAVALVREATERTISGIVTDILVEETDEGRPELQVTLEPAFALCRYRSNIKAYRDKTALDIVGEVLGEDGVSFSLRAAPGAVRPYTVQHRETDFHFVSRLLEEEGLFYFFDEAGTMVIGDSAGAYDAAGPAAFKPAAGLDEHEEGVFAMGAAGRAGAAMVTLGDFTIDAPSAPLLVSAGGGAGPEYYDFPGEYEDAGVGQSIAERTADAFDLRRRGYAGDAAVPSFAPGRTFVLTGSPEGVEDGEYAVTVVTHELDVERGGFHTEFEAVDGDRPARPLLRHHEPVLPNPVTGIVTGPPGEDVHTDELGRVKVWFHWDRLQPRDDQCSHWVPVIQDNTGHSVGIPRVGWEVLVHFLEGDPDRPVVLGRVYNAEDKFYRKLPEDKTVTALRSLSSPTHSGTNLIEIEDKAGREHIQVFAERDQDVVVRGDKREHVMVTESRSVGRNERIEIGGDERVHVGERASVAVVGDQQLEVGGDRERRVGGADSQSTAADRSLTIGGKHQRRLGRSDGVGANNIDHQIGAAIVEASIKGNATRARFDQINTVGGAVIELAGAGKNETAGKGRLETCGGVLFTKASKEIKTTAEKSRITTVGAAFKVKCAEEMGISANDSLSMKAGKAVLSATTSLYVEVGDTTVRIGDGQIAIKAKETIAFVIDSESQLGSGEAKQN
jgi:type VI secretion system secreted protein VgrG